MKTLATHCLDLFSIDPARSAVYFDERWYTWGELRGVAQDIWKSLKSAAVDTSARVTLVPRNRPSALAAFTALLAEDRTISMAYPFQSPAALAQSLEKLDSSAVIMAEEDFSPEVRDVLASRKMAGVVLGETSARLLDKSQEGLPRPDERDGSEPHVRILTSGTTGPPKQFPLSYSAIEDLLRQLGGLELDDVSAETPPVLFSFPVANISGIYCCASSIWQGKRAILLDRFSLDAWREYVRSYRPPVGGLPPAAIGMILDADVPREELESIRYVTTGAAPVDPTVHELFERRYDIPILLSYGATEFGGTIAAMTPELHAQFGRAKFGSVGRSIPGARLRVVDPETGTELPPGQVGCLEGISPRVSGGWVRTSDLAVIDEDGFMWHKGRADDAIMRGGFKILPETVERALVLHPAVAAACVVAVPDRRLYQVPAALVQPKRGAREPSVEELEQHLRQHVLATHIPVHWKFADSLPKNRAFKIDRAQVKRLFESDPAQGS